MSDSGRAVVPPGGSYPLPGHPAPYDFDWKSGRVLDEFQVVYIRSGRGTLETRHGGRRNISAGQAMILFPQEWHRYRPHAATGWHETWVGFQGDYASHLMRQFFRPEAPLVTVANQEDMEWVMKALVAEKANPKGSSSRSMMAVRVLEMISILHEARRANEGAGSMPSIENARLDILVRTSERIDWSSMARRHGLSPVAFRRKFKEATGRSPLGYQIEIRLNQAAELLRHGRQTVGEISEILGYANVHFFSRQFKERMGCSPRDFRTRNGK